MASNASQTNAAGHLPLSSADDRAIHCPIHTSVASATFNCRASVLAI